MLKHNLQPAAAVVAWLAWLASYAVTAYQLFARVIHPHFLPLVLLLLLGLAAGILAVGLGLWRITVGRLSKSSYRSGPGPLAAIGWSFYAAIPVLLWAAHSTYAIASARMRERPLPNLPLRLAGVGGAAAFDGLARFAYSHRLEGEHTVMIYDECDDPEGDLAAMDRHIEEVGKVLGRPLPTKVYWVRGGLVGMTGLLQVAGVSLVGMAICGDDRPPQGSPNRLSYVDRHEAAHNVIMDQLPAFADPPTVLNEGWAETQSGASIGGRAWEVERIGRTNALSIPQFFSPEKYTYTGHEAYFQGSVLVDFLLRRYGGEKFFELGATCRSDTIAEDCRRVYGVDPDQLDDLFWADLRERTADLRERTRIERPKPIKSISAGLGLPDDGPNDESARQDFLQRYPKEVEKLKEAYGHVRMAAVATWENLEPGGDGTPARVEKFEALRCGDRVRLITHDAEETRVFVAAPGQSFRLWKGADDVRFKSQRPGPDSHDWYETTLAAARRDELDAAYFCNHLDIQQWICSPGVKVTRAVRLQEGPRRLIRVHYEYDKPDQDGGWAEGAGWFSFRPDDCWALEAYETRTRSPDLSGPPKGKDGKRPSLITSINQGVVHYQGKENGVPVVASLDRVFNRVGEWKIRGTIRVTEVQFGAPPDETFDLASYDADPPAVDHDDIFARLTRWLVRAIWVCTAGVVISAGLPLVTRLLRSHRRVGQAREAGAAPP